jgi:uncharacterized protein YwgA
MTTEAFRDEDLIGPDLVLLLLAAHGRTEESTDRVNGITRLEKLLFLAEQEKDIGRDVRNAFQFKAYDYGPYSKAVYDAVELLTEAGLINQERAYAGQPLDEMEEWTAGVDQREGLERRFTLTDRGKAIANLLAGQHKEVIAALSDVKRKYGDWPLRQLIRYVYSTYPTYAEASKIRDQVF